MPLLPMMQQRSYVFALSKLSVLSSSRPGPNILKITFLAKLEYEESSKIREKIRIDVNRFCRDVKQVLTPSE